MSACNGLVSEEHIDKKTAIEILALIHNLQTLHKTETHEKETQITALSHKLDLQAVEHQNTATLRALQERVGTLLEENQAVREELCALRKEMRALDESMRSQMTEHISKLTDRIVALETTSAQIVKQKKKSFSSF